MMHSMLTTVGVPVDRPVIETCAPELSKGKKKSLSRGAKD